MEITISAGLLIVALVLYSISNKLFFYSIPILYALIAQSVREYFSVFGVPLNMPMIYGGILLLICFIELAKWIFNPGKDKFGILSILIFLFLFYSALSIIFSVDKTSSFVSLLKISTWMLVLVISKMIFTEKKDLITLSYFAMVSCLVIAFSYLLSRFGIYGAQSLAYEKYDVTVYSGGFWGPTGIALPLVMLIPIIMVNLYLTGGRGKVCYLAIIFLSIFLIFLTYLRSALVMLVMGYIAFIYFLKKNNVRKASMNLIITSMIFLLIFLSFLYFEPTTGLKRWQEIPEQIETKKIEKLASGRVGLFKTGFSHYVHNETLSRQLFGNGLGTSSHVMGVRKIVHNDFLEVLLGCGIIGLLLYITILWAIFFSLRQMILRMSDRHLKILGCLAMMSFFIFLPGNFRHMLQLVFPLSIFSLHIGATLGIFEHEREMG